MNFLFTPFSELEEFNKIQMSIKGNRTPVQVTGCMDSQKVHLMAGLGEEYLYKVIIAENEIKAKELYEDYKLYDRQVYLYPAKDAIFYNADIRGNAIVRQRLKVLRGLIEQTPMCVITTMDGGMDKLLPLKRWAENVLTIEEAGIVDIDKIKRKLVHMGYEHVGQVDGSGQFAIRGGIIDIYPLTEENPYRIELWDDEVDTIRAFDVESQRSIENVDSLKVYPATEVTLSKEEMERGIRKLKQELKAQTELLRGEFKTEEAYRLEQTVSEFIENLTIYGASAGMESVMDVFFEETESLFDYFPQENTLFFVDEPSHVEERANAVDFEFQESMSHRLEKGYLLPSQANVIFPYEKLVAKLTGKKTVLLSMLDYKAKHWNVKEKADMMVTSVAPYHHNFEMLVKDLTNWKKKGYRVVLFSGSMSRAKRLSEDLKQYDLSAFFHEIGDRELEPGTIMVTTGNLHKGFTYPLIQVAFVSESDIFGEKQAKRKKKKTQYDGKSIQNFTELNIGDYVIHENHGVGIYKGIEKITVDKTVKDYVKIEYADGGNLYVLATGLEVLQKYSSGDGKKPKMNKLNSAEWKKTKSRVHSSVRRVAKELVELYAKRQEKIGYRFDNDSLWQREFEEMFPYEETDDQVSAIEATKRDMESTKIMDRLICGDVGFGKTEIAIRAAFKAVDNGKQVAFLVPTTILAQQHYNTFVQRMKEFPIKIGMLSRFRTPAQQKKDLETLKKGQLDIVIGTHRLLSKDVKYHNLGLLIVDEEQRFGVTHKEKIKMLKENVDVLTLSATPIPRTLHMSLIGIRDMSVLEDPPVDRMPIQTFIVEQNDEIVREAINRELARNGQVFYVYNRVKNIEEVAAHIAELVPHAAVGCAHGQMSSRELEKIMYQFIQGELDVLVSTTIVETGLDISNVNTMLVHDADQLGLSQLYQLRGRVGRSNRTAYAFLMYRRNKVLKEVAEKRLQAMREFTELGSGFKIAMTDLEIRGAGSLLGEQQHGHMEAIGYDLYCKMLTEAVREYKGEEVEASFDTTVDVNVDAYIPATYIRSEYQKLEMYKRIAGIENRDEWMDMQEELVDRFGDMPKAVQNLLNIVLLKSMAHQVYVEQVKQKKEKELEFTMFAQAKIKAEKIPPLLEKYKGRLQFSMKPTPIFTFIWSKEKQRGKDDSKNFFPNVIEFLQDMKEELV